MSDTATISPVSPVPDAPVQLNIMRHALRIQQQQAAVLIERNLTPQPAERFRGRALDGVM